MGHFGWSREIDHIQYTGGVEEVLEKTKMKLVSKLGDSVVLSGSSKNQFTVNLNDYIFILGYRNYAIITPGQYRLLPDYSKGDRAIQVVEDIATAPPPATEYEYASFYETCMTLVSDIEPA